MIAEKLRKAVLQAAMQGKLTEQLPEDGNARDLLRDLLKKKGTLIKQESTKEESPSLIAMRERYHLKCPRIGSG